MEALIRLRRSVHGHPVAADAVVASLAGAITLLTALGDLRPGGARPGPPTILVAVLTCGALMLRRRRPFAVLAVTIAGAGLFLMLSPSHGWALASPLVALYSAADATGRSRALTAGWLAVLVLVLAHALARPVPWFGAENVTLIALGGLAVAAGDASRSRRAYVAEVEERARRAERDRELEARRRVTEERLRIARDLHDSMGHHLALINVQAGAAAAVLDTRPGQARDAVEHIGQASRAALDELAGTVALLRGAGDPAAPTGPAGPAGPVGLAGLDDLIGSFRKAGLRIERETVGTPRPVPAAVDTVAYRVVEESLTNVRRHTEGATVRVVLAYGPAALRVRVQDDGGRENGGGAPERPPRAAVSGHGLAGMRERAVTVGGHLHAGPEPAGRGFRVSAVLPLPEGRWSG